MHFDSCFYQILSKNINVNFWKTFFIPDSKPITQPYWLANKMEEGYFNVTISKRSDKLMSTRLILPISHWILRDRISILQNP